MHTKGTHHTAPPSLTHTHTHAHRTPSGFERFARGTHTQLHSHTATHTATYTTHSHTHTHAYTRTHTHTAHGTGFERGVGAGPPLSGGRVEESERNAKPQHTAHSI